MLIRIIVVTILIIIGNGCATEPSIQYVVKPLPLPTRPALPKITASELSCLTDQTYKKIGERDRERRQYAEELEVIIRATHEKDEQ